MNRYPYHRYLRWLALEGEPVDDICAHIEELGFVKPRRDDVEFIVRELTVGRAKDENGVVADAEWRSICDVEMFDAGQGTSDLDRCYWIVDTPVVRTLAEKALLDGLNLRQVTSVVNLRTRANVNEATIKLFRDGFWDSNELTSIEWSNYYRLGELHRERLSKDVPITQQVAAAAWAAGLVPEEEQLSTEDIVRSIQVSAYLQFAEASKKGDSGVAAQRWASMALKASAMQRAKKIDKSQTALPLMKPRVHYPENQHTPDLAELEVMQRLGQTQDLSPSAALDEEEPI